MSDRDQIMREREIARKAWCAMAALHPDTPPQRGLAAYLDREHQLPESEPKTVTGPSMVSWTLITRGVQRGWVCLDRKERGQVEGLGIPAADLPTVANLLCPFEEVVRAALEDMHVTSIECHGNARNLCTNESRNAFLAAVPAHLPAILARLGESK